MSKQYRQGDVLLHPIAQIPQTAKRAVLDGRIVLAEGEATGHAHTIECSPQVIPYTDGTMLYLEVQSPVSLEHQEHAPLSLEPGCYEVRRQVEVWLDELRRVAD